MIFVFLAGRGNFFFCGFGSSLGIVRFSLRSIPGFCWIFFSLCWFGEFGLEGKVSVPFYLSQKSLMELFSVALVLLTVDLLSDQFGANKRRLDE